MCLTLGVGAPSFAVCCTDSRIFHSFPDGRVDHFDVGGKLRRVRNGWGTCGGCGQYGFAALDALESVDVRDPEAVTARLREIAVSHPATIPTRVTLVYHDGERFQARSYDETGEQIVDEGAESDGDPSRGAVLIGWPTGMGDHKKEIQDEFVAAVTVAATVPEITRCVLDLFASSHAVHGSWMSDEVEGILLARNGTGRIVEVPITKTRRPEGAPA